MGAIAMPQTRIAKAIQERLQPSRPFTRDFRFDGDQVYATRDELTGDAVLSNRPGAKVWRIL